jgi:hypothetical protein
MKALMKIRHFQAWISICIVTLLMISHIENYLSAERPSLLVLLGSVLLWVWMYGLVVGHIWNGRQWRDRRPHAAPAVTNRIAPHLAGIKIVADSTVPEGHIRIFNLRPGEYDDVPIEGFGPRPPIDADSPGA